MPIHHPFYVVAPAYDSASAGNRVLYTLAEQLERLGYEAFVALSDKLDRPPPALPEGHFVRYLDAQTTDRHFRTGLTPITIYPEISKDLSPAGVRVFYLLNYVGLMGGPERIPECEYVLAYAENIARRTSRWDQIMFIPVSDPNFWAPDLALTRDVVSVYAGKYVDHHGQSIPSSLTDAFQIERHGAHAPTREQLRTILQRSTCLHIFENTAVATEALLCGCPVVFHRNHHFLELIAEHELGMVGVTADDNDVAIAEAADMVTYFRENYLRAQRRITASIATFAVNVQRIARIKPYLDKFDVMAVSLGQ